MKHFLGIEKESVFLFTMMHFMMEFDTKCRAEDRSNIRFHMGYIVTQFNVPTSINIDQRIGDASIVFVLFLRLSINCSLEKFYYKFRHVELIQFTRTPAQQNGCQRKSGRKTHDHKLFVMLPDCAAINSDIMTTRSIFR